MHSSSQKGQGLKKLNPWRNHFRCNGKKSWYCSVYSEEIKVCFTFELEQRNRGTLKWEMHAHYKYQIHLCSMIQLVNLACRESEVDAGGVGRIWKQLWLFQFQLLGNLSQPQQVIVYCHSCDCLFAKSEKAMFYCRTGNMTITASFLTVNDRLCNCSSNSAVCFTY